jgi:hypothetical protein
MNELIEELAEQARRYANEYVDDEVESQYQLKFAELIVRECAQLVQGVPTDTMGYHTADQKIKQHFGVK